MGMQKKLIVLAILAMFMELTMAATTYTVGSPSGGWDTNTDLQAWVSDKSFLVDDSLLFTYTSNHDVLEVSSKDFDDCVTSNPIFTDASGSTTISLTSAGKRYFICGTPGHCSQGQKVEITTLLVQTTAPPPPVASEPPPPVASEPPPPVASEPPPPVASEPPPSPPPSPVTPPPTTTPPKTPPRSPPTSPVTPPPTTAPPTTPPRSPPTSPVTPPPTTAPPMTQPPATSPAPKGNSPATPKSSAHKSSFQGILALAISFLTVFLAL